MIKRIGNWIIRRQTKGYTRVPLFAVMFNYKKFLAEGKTGSCTIYNLHPDLMTDEYLRVRMQECIDHIRDNYDMEQIVKL